MTKPNLEHYVGDVLRYLDDKLYTSSAAVGRHLGASKGFGTKVLRQMSARGLVLWLPDVECWRISRQGREYLQSATKD